ncbi:efflux RND transporter periplasmic adaptor subunit [Odoribacter sp. OttesenSCG-928-L07]|nr:efflux RND transporter periplasmic adaptor subunit [Odoribacter sp. OttesenSCG-928-L07]MDL2239316.1 efflux RND transporter periplasmic adaptor subunit [Bacteroidales bacterium OttesenSCG-928-L14]MDL2240361.1 efflux RND transporter periplasmic adaptor subunit [Bacteroidales bacterium OttesenSCG-928-K22]
MKKNIKLTIIIAIIAIIVGLGFYLFSNKTTKAGIVFKTAPVAKGTISHVVTATGTLEPIIQVEVGTQVSGIVSKIYVDYNSEVKKGQIIAELDKTNLQNELESKQSNVAISKTEFEYQQKNYERNKILHEKQLISDADYDLSYYNYSKAKNSYNISKNDLAKAQTNLDYATIYSPIDGVVLSRAVEEGQTVAASFSTPTLFTIANDLTQMQVIANVDEADIGGVNEGLRVEFSVDAFPGEIFSGNVTQVRQEAQITSNVVTYEVVISAYNPDLKLKPGLTANISIFTIEKKGILTVPSKALRFTPDERFLPKDAIINNVNAKTVVWTREGNTFNAKAVETGISGNNLTEIISGISEGTQIITEAVAGQMPNQGPMPNMENGNKSNGSSPFMPQRRH